MNHKTAFIMLSLALAPFIPEHVHAKTPTETHRAASLTKAPEAFHASGVSYNDKRLALMFLSEELMRLGTNGGPATDEYLGLQENIMADEESPRTVHHLAMSYKSRHPEEDSFAAAFAPTERLVFEKDGVWHALDLAGTTPVGERCYTQSGAATRCP